MSFIKSKGADGAEPPTPDAKLFRFRLPTNLIASLPGTPLTARDLESMQRSGITPASAEGALLRRVDSFTGAQIVGRNGSGEYAGIVIPYIWPGDSHIREYRLRRDHPEIENGRPKNKYLSPPGRGNMLYFVPGTPPEWLRNPTLPVILAEGEKKCLALSELAWYGSSDASHTPRWLSVAVSGVWNWKGTVGKCEGPNGERLDEKGPIPDLERITWSDRRVIILFDSNIHTNESVRIARLSLGKELRRRGGRVLFVDIPSDAGVNGVDDLIGAWGEERVIQLISHGAYEPQHNIAAAHSSKVKIDQIPSVRSFDSTGIRFVIENLIAGGSVNMLSGESGHGKSTVALAMAYAIANGLEFAGRKCSQGPVLILDRENSIDAMQERYDRLGIKDESGLIAWGGWLEEEAPSPGAPVVIEWVQKTDPKPVVIVDTVVAFLSGDENNASEVRKFMGQLRHLANLGATAIAIHHSSEKTDTPQNYRGSSDFKGSIDIGINIRNFGEGGELSKIRLKAFKNRFAIDREVILNYCNGQFVTDDRANSGAHTLTKQLTELLRKNPGVNKTEFENLASSLELGRNRARTFLEDGVVTGKVQVIVFGRNNARCYRLLDVGDRGSPVRHPL